MDMYWLVMVMCWGLCSRLCTAPFQRTWHVLLKYIPFSSREISVVQPDSPPSRPLLCVHWECWLPALPGRHLLEVIDLPSGHWCSWNICVFWEHRGLFGQEWWLGSASGHSFWQSFRQLTFCFSCHTESVSSMFKLGAYFDAISTELTQNV